MGDHHFTPYDSQEFEEWDYWRTQAMDGNLDTYPCIAAWSDICGFGSVLSKARWNLQKTKEFGLFTALSHAYSLFGKPLITGVPPMPTDRVLVINDGIARTTDLSDSRFVNHVDLLFYVRDLLMNHFMLERLLFEQNLGLRTVLAGGERCQYSPQKSTGQSFLYYTNEPSEHSRELLKQQFVYNPAEFQMNTAFSLAYTIDAFGSSKGIIPNRVFIEESWLRRLNEVMPEPNVIDGHDIHFLWHNSPGISISFDDCRPIEAKGIATTVYRVCKFVVHQGFESERTEFPMSSHDIKL